MYIVPFPSPKMKIVSYKRINRVRVGSGLSCGVGVCSNNWRNYFGFGFALKVTAVFLITCTIVAFQVATTLSAKSESQEDVANLIRHLQQSQLQSQSNSQEPQPVSFCHSCGESETDVVVIQQITNEELELANVNGDDSSSDNHNGNSNGILNLNLQFEFPQLGKSVNTTTTTSTAKDKNSVNKNNIGKIINGDLKTITNTEINASAKEIQILTSSSEILDNVFFSVKSTKRFHMSRLEPVLQTWFNLAKEQTWIFTDDDDPELMEKTNGHTVNTHCPSTHYRQALCCKMATEFDTFIQTTKSWFCHFDDDNYVNVPALLEMLGKYNSRDYWYLGKPSLKSPIRIRDPDNHTEEVSFWFATGGAGFCLSRALALRMSPLASGGKFTKICDRIQLPDDVTVGYIAGHLLSQNLTVIPQFHSHFETMKFIDMKSPSSEITFSYLRYPEYENVLDVDGFSAKDDPTRFLSLHCRLFPNFSFCSNSGSTSSTNKDINTSSGMRRRRRR